MRIVRSLCIYEWKSWDGFLLPMMFPGATRVRARLGETSADLLKRIPSYAGSFAFHVNLTDTRRTPLRRAAFCRALRARGIRILNEQVTDISKHRVQEVCTQAGLGSTRAARAGDPDEVLIVKTNDNYGGEKVERFIENRGHVFYRAHKVMDRVIISRMVNPAGIKKMLQQIRRTNWYLHLPALEPIEGPRPMPMHVARTVSRFCTAVQLDVGSIDVLEDDDGECHVIDINASPFWGEAGYDHMLRFLAGGL